MIPIVKRTIHIFPCDVPAHPYCRPFFRRTRHLQRVQERIHECKSHPRTVALLPCRIERLHCLRDIRDGQDVVYKFSRVGEWTLPEETAAPETTPAPPAEAGAEGTPAPEDEDGSETASVPEGESGEEVTTPPATEAVNDADE